ncbi:DEAD/DEAH box helicase [Hugenholtzia roseola]|uniref:DEAD/DEAH box helicase n=1 Tax=Hugenholtzia roseola TaxID=1002 RepID=UPI0003FBEB00|nr:DEAD/DEAH box helicase family protein [Hugenholtzia roseola]
MIQFKNYQEAAISELCEKSFKLWGQPKYRQNLIFESPTGSGKTLMMAEFLRRFCEELPNQLSFRTKKVSFIWISPNKLYQQSHLALKSFFGEKRTLQPIFFEDISDKKLYPNQVLFLNWESINKETNVYVRSDENDRSLYHILNNTRSYDHEIVVVIDEEHLFSNPRTAKKAEAVLQNINAKVEVRVSATPQSRGATVQVSRQEVIEEEMIKTGIVLNPMLGNYAEAQPQGKKSLDHYLIDAALDKRQEIASAYKKLGIDINPLLLIQLPNDTKEELTTDERNYISLVIDYLGAQHKISVQNGRLAIWLSNQKENLSDNDGKDDQKIRRKNSLVDVLLFKQAIAMGWDCPRAAVLLIFRDIKSTSFTIQTVGRILRMPEQKHYPDSLLNQGYVYTNLSRDIIQIVKDDMGFITFDKAVRKESYQPLDLKTHLDSSKIIRNRLRATYKRSLFAIAEQYWGMSITSLEQKSIFDINRDVLRKRIIEIDHQKIDIAVPENVYLTGEEQNEVVASKVRFARSFDELRRLFYNFCRKNIGSYAPIDSTPILELALFELFSRYLGMDDKMAMKIVLHNQEQFADLIAKSFSLYEKQQQEEASKRSRKIETQTWEVPKYRIYNDLYVEEKSNLHILEPYFSLQKASNPEKEFVRFLEQGENYIEWWYKNGDKGKEHLAIAYTNLRGELSLFYVDFIVKLKSGKIAIFDTKTPNSDPEAASKHNALVAYCEKESQRGAKLIGSVVLYLSQSGSPSFLYHKQTIEDTHLHYTKGWDDLSLHLPHL